MSEFLEITMVVCFGISWPLNIIRSYKSRSAKGQSIMFLLIVFLGYIAGIISKFINESYMADFANKWYIVVFYCINFVMVGIDILVYFRNARLDKQRQNDGKLENGKES